MRVKSLIPASAGFLVLSLSGPLQSAEPNTPFHLYASIGDARTEYRPSPIDVVSGKDNAVEIGVGYSFNNYLSLQGSYRNFGEPVGFAGCPPEVLCIAQYAPSDVDIDGWSVALTGTLPVANRFDLFGKVGMTAWDASANDPALNDSGEDLTLEGGVTWNVADRWGVQASYEWIDRDIKSTKIGAIIRF